MPIWIDPIVEEIHSIRRRLSKECGDDLDRLVDRLRMKEELHKERLVLRCGSGDHSAPQRQAQR